jgi:hypothetical protein
MPIKYSKDKELEIVRLHDLGTSPKTIADLMGTYNTTIRRILLRNGRELKGQSEALASVLVNPFEDLSLDSVQYWLGYICADGNISKDPRNRINVSSNLDPDHLDSYCEFVGQGTKVASYINKRYSVMEYSVNFSNKKIKEFLVSLGITPNKSLDIKLSMPLTSAWLRGLMDGDGCVRHKTDRSVHVCIASASKALVNQIEDFLVSNKIKWHCRKDVNLYSLEVHGFDNVSAYYNLIYKDATYFLMRKRLKFGSLIAKDISDNPANSVKADSILITPS